MGLSEAYAMHDRVDSDLLEGAAQIANFLQELGLNVDRRRAFHLCATKQIPSGKLGGKVIGSKHTIRAHLEKLASQAAA
jgi:hypothetical protein